MVEDIQERQFERIVLPRDLVALYLRSSLNFADVSSTVNRWINVNNRDATVPMSNTLRRVAGIRNAEYWQVRLLI